MQWNYLLVSIIGDVEGTMDRDVALECAAFGWTVIDTQLNMRLHVDGTYEEIVEVEHPDNW